MADGTNDPGLSGQSARSFARSGRNRAGIQLEAVPGKAPRSQAARNGFVIFGNAIIWLLFIGLFCAAGATVYGSRQI